MKNINIVLIVHFVMFFAGVLVGVLIERFKYYKKTGEHLQDVKSKE